MTTPPGGRPAWRVSAQRVRLRDGVEVEDLGERVRLVSRHPARTLDLSPSVRSVLAVLSDGRLAEHAGQWPVLSSPPHLPDETVSALLDYLVRRGFAEERAPGREPAAVRPEARLPRVSAVVAVRERPRELARCLRSLLALRWPPSSLEIVVVDDGSPDATPRVAQRFGDWAARQQGRAPAVVLHRLPSHAGIAEARNHGLQRATGDLVAFIDSDCVADPLWLRRLTPSLVPPVAAVGGGVDGLRHRTALQRYEATYSPLHMGEHSGRAGRGTRAPYLPTCNLLVSRQAALAVGGFDPRLQVGEDVDFSRRLEDAGYRLRYEATARVAHDHRDTLRTFLNRRAAYGSSEGPLRRRPTTAERSEGAYGTAESWLAGLGFAGAWAIPGLLPATLLTLATSSALGLRRLMRWYQAGRPVPLGVILASVPRLGVASIHQFGEWVLRYWSIPLVGAGLIVRARGIRASPLRSVAGLAIATALIEWYRRRPRLDPVRASLFYLADVTAYQVGAWTGGVHTGRLGFLKPAFRAARDGRARAEPQGRLTETSLQSKRAAWVRRAAWVGGSAAQLRMSRRMISRTSSARR